MCAVSLVGSRGTGLAIATQERRRAGEAGLTHFTYTRYQRLSAPCTYKLVVTISCRKEVVLWKACSAQSLLKLEAALTAVRALRHGDWFLGGLDLGGMGVVVELRVVDMLSSIESQYSTVPRFGDANDLARTLPSRDDGGHFQIQPIELGLAQFFLTR
jgi:hypothetical protein